MARVEEAAMKRVPLNQQIARELRGAMRHDGVTQTELVRRSGIRQQDVSNLLNY